MKTCKYCIEEIKKDALVCKHCGRNQEIMNKHVTILSIFYFAIGTILMFLSIIALVALPLIGNFIPEDAIPFDLFSFLGAGIGGIFFLFSMVKLIGAYGLLKRKSWGRIYVLVLCVLGLLSFPFGTLIGIYGIWILTKDETINLFIN